MCLTRSCFLTLTEEPHDILVSYTCKKIEGALLVPRSSRLYCFHANCRFIFFLLIDRERKIYCCRELSMKAKSERPTCSLPPTSVSRKIHLAASLRTERKDRSPGALSTSRQIGQCPACATGKALPSYGVPIVCTTSMLRIYESASHHF